MFNYINAQGKTEVKLIYNNIFCSGMSYLKPMTKGLLDM
jgi:hypothetical protein